MNRTYATMSEYNIQASVNNLFTFSSLLTTFNFSSVLIVFTNFCTWIALGDVDLHFSLILVTNAKAIGYITIVIIHVL